MNRRCWLIVGLVGLALTTGFGLAEDQKSRNPFGVADVPDTDGEDVKAFADKVKLAGDDKDPNAEQWVKKETPGKANSLDGDWAGRWNGGAGTDWIEGTATIKTVKDRVYILYKDEAGTLPTLSAFT